MIIIVVVGGVVLGVLLLQIVLILSPHWGTKPTPRAIPIVGMVPTIGGLEGVVICGQIHMHCVRQLTALLLRVLGLWGVLVLLGGPIVFILAWGVVLLVVVVIIVVVLVVLLVVVGERGGVMALGETLHRRLLLLLLPRVLLLLGHGGAITTLPRLGEVCGLSTLTLVLGLVLGLL